MGHGAWSLELGAEGEERRAERLSDGETERWRDKSGERELGCRDSGMEIVMSTINA